jgi:two-component system chemotaxis sensor kinase CheA
MNAIHHNEPNHKKLKGAKILIVEDDYLAVMFLEKVFEPYECVIIHANNGKKAMDLLIEESSFDMILLDLNMPIMNGYDTVKEVRKLHTEVPIIALTGNVKLVDDDALVEGFNEYLTKPIKESKMLQVINKYLSIE